MQPLVAQLLSIIDQAYDRKSWHGTNLRGSIRGVSSGQASWRPSPARHNIREITVHAAYWKYAVWRRLTGATRGSFEMKGSNWFKRGNGDDRSWRADVSLLDRSHRELRAAIEALRDEDLEATQPGSKLNNAALLSGIAAHDLYHAGQIQLLKQLGARRARREARM